MPLAECDCGGKENHGNQEDEAAQEGSKEEGVQEEGRRQEVKHPFSEDDFANHWKAMTSDGIKGLLEERTATTRSFFKHLGELFMKKHAKNLKSFGFNYHRREEFQTKADDDIVDPKELEKFIKAESEKAGEQMWKAMQYGYANTLTTFNLKQPDEAMRKKIQEMAARNVTYVTDTTKNQIRDLLDKAAADNLDTGEISAQMRDYFDVPDNLAEVPLDEGFISAARVQTIVRTETLSAVSAGQDAKNREFQKEYPEEGKRLQKIWLTARDERVRDGSNGDADHVALEGQIVGYDEDFDNGLKFPREPDGPAEEVINCRCTWLSFLPEDQQDIEGNIADGGSEAIPAGVEIDESKGGPGSGRKPEGGSNKPMSPPSGAVSRVERVELDERSPQHAFFATRNTLIDSGHVAETDDLDKFNSWWVHRGAEMAGQSADAIQADYDAYTYDMDSTNEPSTPKPRPPREQPADVTASAKAGNWEENDHPRGHGGQFSSGSGTDDSEVEVTEGSGGNVPVPVGAPNYTDGVDPSTVVQNQIPVESIPALEKYKERSSFWKGSLRSGVHSDEVDLIDKAMSTSQLNSDVTVYRTMHESDLPSNLKEGTVIADKAYLSTSTSEKMVKDFAENSGYKVTMVIKAPAGSRAINMDKVLGSENSNLETSINYKQQEILFDRNSNLSITGIKTVGKQKVLTCDLIQSEDVQASPFGLDAEGKARKSMPPVKSAAITLPPRSKLFLKGTS